MTPDQQAGWLANRSGNRAFRSPLPSPAECVPRGLVFLAQSSLHRKRRALGVKSLVSHFVQPDCAGSLKYQFSTSSLKLLIHYELKT